MNSKGKNKMTLKLQSKNRGKIAGWGKNSRMGKIAGWGKKCLHIKKVKRGPHHTDPSL